MSTLPEIISNTLNREGVENLHKLLDKQIVNFRRYEDVFEIAYIEDDEIKNILFDLSYMHKQGFEMQSVLIGDISMKDYPFSEDGEVFSLFPKDYIIKNISMPYNDDYYQTGKFIFSIENGSEKKEVYVEYGSIGEDENKLLRGFIKGESEFNDKVFDKVKEHFPKLQSLVEQKELKSIFSFDRVVFSYQNILLFTLVLASLFSMFLEEELYMIVGGVSAVIYILIGLISIKKSKINTTLYENGFCIEYKSKFNDIKSEIISLENVISFDLDFRQNQFFLITQTKDDRTKEINVLGEIIDFKSLDEVLKFVANKKDIKLKYKSYNKNLFDIIALKNKRVS